MNKIPVEKPSKIFKVNLETLFKTLNNNNNENTYYITLISMTYAYFENFIKLLIDYKNDLILLQFPKKIEHFNEIENLLYFASQEEQINDFIKELQKHHKTKNLNEFKKCYANFNQKVLPTNELSKIDFNPFSFKQHIKDLIKNFKTEFGDEIIDKIELIDYFEDTNPVKSLKIKSYINGKTFYSRYLSNPRSVSIHETKIDDNFKNEIIEKNKIKLWKKLIIEFTEKIEIDVITKIENN